LLFKLLTKILGEEEKAIEEVPAKCRKVYEQTFRGVKKFTFWWEEGSSLLIKFTVSVKEMTGGPKKKEVRLINLNEPKNKGKN